MVLFWVISGIGSAVMFVYRVGTLTLTDLLVCIPVIMLGPLVALAVLFNKVKDKVIWER